MSKIIENLGSSHRPGFAVYSDVSRFHVGYQTGSASVTTDTGDHDLIPDNCELVTTLPQTVGNLAVGQSAPATFSFNLGKNGNSASCGSTIPFTATVVSDQSPATPRAFNLQAEQDAQSGTIAYDFEADFSGWTLATGTFTRAVGGAPGSTGFSLHSRSANSICDAILSPVFTPSASSTMDMWVNFSIEGNAGAGSRWDRAVVRVVNTTNSTKTLVVPTGVAYNTTGSDPALCDGIGSLQGWSGDRLVWSQATFNLGGFAGIPIRIEVRYSTDNSTLGTQGTAATPLTIDKGNPSETLTFAEVGSAAVYHVYAGTLLSLQAGVYDHAVAPLPENAYFIAVAANAAGESNYGTSSVGFIPPGVTTCP